MTYTRIAASSSAGGWRVSGHSEGIDGLYVRSKIDSSEGHGGKPIYVQGTTPPKYLYFREGSGFWYAGPQHAWDGKRHAELMRSRSAELSMTMAWEKRGRSGGGWQPAPEITIVPWSCAEAALMGAEGAADASHSKELVPWSKAVADANAPFLQKLQRVVAERDAIWSPVCERAGGILLEAFKAECLVEAWKPDAWGHLKTLGRFFRDNDGKFPSDWSADVRVQDSFIRSLQAKLSETFGEGRARAEAAEPYEDASGASSRGGLHIWAIWNPEEEICAVETLQVHGAVSTPPNKRSRSGGSLGTTPQKRPFRQEVKEEQAEEEEKETMPVGMRSPRASPVRNEFPIYDHIAGAAAREADL